MEVRTCIEEASRSMEPSGHSTYAMSSCHTDYRSRVKERNGCVNLNVAYNNQCVTLPIWGG
eukprot:1809729-Ditylum_brightwellii.AAC.1